MSKILIIGLGYVGKALAKHFKSKEMDVWATCRQDSSLDTCHKLNITPIDLRESPLTEIALHPFSHIIVCVAPGKNGSYEDTYLNLAKTITLRSHVNTQIIYTGSTSVYGDHFGVRVTEQSELNTFSINGKILIETEKTYLKQKRSCIFRLGQIIGPDREILKSIENHRNYALGDGKSPINLSPIKDILNGIDFAIEHDLRGIFNLCIDFHPYRCDLYDRILLDAKLLPFPWDKNSKSKSSKIVCSKQITTLGFHFSDINL